MTPKQYDPKQHQKEIAAKLYATSKSNDPRLHARLEKEYNQIGKQIHIAKGKRGDDYVYKRDVREEFNFWTEDKKRADGSNKRVEIAEGPLYDPNTVINWRNTKVGETDDNKRKRQTRKEFGKTGDGDDVGHRIALRFGVDPADKRNVGMQNRQQNQAGGTYYDAENRACATAVENPNAKLKISVREEYIEKRGEKRSISRKIDITDSNGKRIDSGNVSYGNFKAKLGPDGKPVRTKRSSPPKPSKGSKPKLVRAQTPNPQQSTKKAAKPQSAKKTRPVKAKPKAQTPATKKSAPSATRSTPTAKKAPPKKPAPAKPTPKPPPRRSR